VYHRPLFFSRVFSCLVLCMTFNGRWSTSFNLSVGERRIKRFQDPCHMHVTDKVKKKTFSLQSLALPMILARCSMCPTADFGVETLVNPSEKDTTVLFVGSLLADGMEFFCLRGTSKS
jgi:hypothetical protein